MKPGMALIYVALASPAAATNFASYELRAVVPLACSVNFAPTPGSAQSPAALGKLHEYCNSPHGYEVRMYYPAGTLQGAVVHANGNSIALDGSGTAVVDSAVGATARQIEVVASSQDSRSVDRTLLTFAIDPR